MSWLYDVWLDVYEWLPVLATLFYFALSISCIGWVLMAKTDATSAVAWCLLIILLPFVGSVFFYFFGYQHVDRPLRRKRRHKEAFQIAYGPAPLPGSTSASTSREGVAPKDLSLCESLARLADSFGAYPLTRGNHIDFYQDGGPAFAAMLEAIRGAQHHIHLEFFIFHADEIGCQFLVELARKAKEGVEVRLLYDAMGSHGLQQSHLQPLRAAGGKISVFLPLNPFRRRLQVNMRNHRKILVVDGRIGFVGGLNIGDEYMGKHPYFGYWRDTHLRLQGPAVADLQRVFSEDWDFAADEHLTEGKDPASARMYFQARDAGGPYPVQIIDSGPDRDLKGIREIYFAAILKARQRLWIASPYFVPDAGLLDALRLAGYQGIDVRFLGQLYPDKWIPQFAARYHWRQVLPAGVKIYQYTRGMMHSKLVLVDGEWASVGTANLDNRSLHLNFEVNCLIYSSQAVAQLEEAFLRDLSCSIRLDPEVYLRRPFAARLLENTCRLMSPVL
jgi:cardiolipin synthase A/B